MIDEEVIFLKDTFCEGTDSIWWSSEPMLYWEETNISPIPAKCNSCEKEGPMMAFQSADEGYHPVWICLPCLQDIISEVEVLRGGNDDNEEG